MREAAADLNFEEAARLRDEVKRLRATELAVVDDPTIKQRGVAAKAGPYAGKKKYGDAANLPAQLDKLAASKAKRATGGKSRRETRRPVSRAPRLFLPLAGRVDRHRREKSMQSAFEKAGPGGGASKIHKPSLDEMGIATWHEVKPTQRKAAQTYARRNGPGDREQDFPADQFAAVGSGILRTCHVRSLAAFIRRGAGASRWVEEEMIGRRQPHDERKAYRALGEGFPTLRNAGVADRTCQILCNDAFLRQTPDVC